MDKKHFNNQFNLDPFEMGVISFVGGGGKTTTIQKMASTFKNYGAKVLCTTSTAKFKPTEEYYDKIFIGDIPQDYTPRGGSITVYGEYEEGEKLKSKNIGKIENIIKRNIFDYILIEADGANRKPIKAPADHEPVISNFTTITVGVIGMDCIGENINIIAHRPNLLKKILNVQGEHILKYNDLVKLALHENGLFKNSIGKKILFLNKVKETQFPIVKEIKKILIHTDIEVQIGRFNNNIKYK